MKKLIVSLLALIILSPLIIQTPVLAASGTAPSSTTGSSAASGTTPSSTSGSSAASGTAPSSTTGSSSCGGGLSVAQCSACAGIQQLGNTQDCSSKGSAINSLIGDTVSILSYIIGVIAIIMIIISGIKYALSGGNANSIEEAKKTLIYAIIGLILAALAQVLVRWVLNTSANISTTTSTTITFHDPNSSKLKTKI